MLIIKVYSIAIINFLVRIFYSLSFIFFSPLISCVFIVLIAKLFFFLRWQLIVTIYLFASLLLPFFYWCLIVTWNAMYTCDASKSTKGASKQRRDSINAEIANLRDLLPLPSSTRQRLSQLQLMALVCVYVRKSNYFQNGKLINFN